MLFLIVCFCAAQPSSDFETSIEKYSYQYGRSAALRLLEDSVDIDIVAFEAGFSAAFDEREPLLSGEQRTNALEALQVWVETRKQNDSAEWRRRNEAFLSVNASRDGVEATSSGLQYIVLEEGQGPHPRGSQKVVAYLDTTLITGQRIELTRGIEQPIHFVFRNNLPVGMAEALQMMKAGSHYRFFVPATLAYGTAGYRDIPADSLLIMEFKVDAILD